VSRAVIGYQSTYFFTKLPPAAADTLCAKTVGADYARYLPRLTVSLPLPPGMSTRILLTKLARPLTTLRCLGTARPSDAPSIPGEHPSAPRTTRSPGICSRVTGSWPQLVGSRWPHTPFSVYELDKDLWHLGWYQHLHQHRHRLHSVVRHQCPPPRAHLATSGLPLMPPQPTGIPSVMRHPNPTLAVSDTLLYTTTGSG
jgi:hypothetical protein